MQKDSYTLAEIAEITSAKLQGDPACRINSLASLARAHEGQVTFLTNTRYNLLVTSRYEKMLPYTKASAVLLAPVHADKCSVNKLIVEDPYAAYLKLATLFQRKEKIQPGIHPTAVIGKDCQIAPSSSIGPHCVIGDNSIIGDQTFIKANTVVGDNTSIGSHCEIFANVTIYHDIQIGNGVIIQSGVIIGSDGFGMVRDKDGWKKIPHLATVIIGDNVEIGANTTIDRGALNDTVLENGVKLDNLIQIAHGVVIGENTVIAGCTGVAGSTNIGKNCMIGGATGISDNITICDNVIFTGMSQVTKSITKPGVYSSGTSILPQRAWHKNIARLHNLDDFARKLKKLESAQNE